MHDPDLVIVGGGLAGCEAAWQAAKRGLRVRLFEMRPAHSTGAHTSDRLAELVCSNSLGSMLPDRASGVLLAEARQLGSFLVRAAEASAVPAGAALAVDREVFSSQFFPICNFTCKNLRELLNSQFAHRVIRVYHNS